MNFESLINVLKRIAEAFDFTVVITVEDGKISHVDFNPLEKR